MSGTAEALIREHLIGCLPPGSPPSFRRIVSAAFKGAGRTRRAIGRLEMFDGQPATVEVFKAGEALGITFWGHCWTDMPGGMCSLEPGGWVRCDAEGNILSAQLPPPLSPVPVNPHAKA